MSDNDSISSDKTKSTPPPGAGVLLRFAALWLIVGGVALAFLYTGGWFTPHALTPKSMINTFEKLNGQHPGFRRNHSKGVCISGYFEGNGKGSEFSKASVFAVGKIPVIGRFALASGQPYLSDAAPTARSMALLFQLPNGEEWRTGMNNIPVFLVNTTQGFYELLNATAPDPATGKPSPEKMGPFLKAHPETAKAFGVIKSTPPTSGFADSTYNSLNAFRFIDSKGNATPVRWGMVTAQSVTPFNPASVDASATNYQFDALITDIHKHPLQWHLIVTIGQPGDSTADSTVAWPADRQHIDVGTLTIDKVESEDTSPARDINFDPLVLPNGITGSDDPLLSARSAAYSQSFTRREGEHKSPSAVSVAETQK